MIETVTMYKVVCDVDGCDKSTGDLSGDYIAWGDAAQAANDWAYAGGAVTDDKEEQHFCPSHANRVCLECRHVGDPDYIDAHDMCRACDEADR